MNLAARAAGGTAGARRDSDQHDQNDDDQCADTEQCDDEGQVQKPAVVVLSVVVVSRLFLGVDDGRVHVDDEVDVAGARRIAVVARRHSQRNGLEHDVRQIGARTDHAARTEIHV